LISLILPNPNLNLAMNATCTAPSSELVKSSQKPRYSVSRRDDAFVIRVDMPGVAKSSLSLEFQDDVLSMRGERISEQPNSLKMLHQEYSTQPFQLCLRFPAQVDEDQLNASLEDGVLTLNLPLKPSPQPRRIEVN
jgi:HSP20 family protein